MVETQTIELPVAASSRAEDPLSDVVIYDGQCPFCRHQVARLHRWDSRRRLKFLSLHDPRVRQWAPELEHEALMEQMWVIDPQGGRHAGGDALRYLARRLPPLWPLVPLLSIPGTGPLWRYLYGRVAQRRYHLRGGRCDDSTCDIATDRPKTE